MRPIRRGAAPQVGDYGEYRDAFPDLFARLGPYCSYCERRINTGLAVEHIQAKSRHPHLVGRWENLLLACVNCNATKGDRNADPSEIFLPDRDNTFAAFIYPPDGTVQPSPAHAAGLPTLALTGLEKRMSEILDENGKLVAIDRLSQRLETWSIAQIAKGFLDGRPNDPDFRASVTMNAGSAGFFSIWMTVYANDPEMRNRLIDAFPGTRASGCFDPTTTAPISPAPNPDRLPHGGKL